MSDYHGVLYADHNVTRRSGLLMVNPRLAVSAPIHDSPKDPSRSSVQGHQVWAQISGHSPLDPARQGLRPFASLLAADALLGLSASPHSPVVQTTPYDVAKHTPHFPSPVDHLPDKDQYLCTPFHTLLSSSPGRYWNLQNSISPILRTSSPDHDQNTPSESSHLRRGSTGSKLRSETALGSRRLSTMSGLSPLSDVSTSSGSASIPDTTPSGSSLPSSSALQASANLRVHPPAPSVITADDWDPPTYRYATRSRAKNTVSHVTPPQAGSSRSGSASANLVAAEQHQHLAAWPGLVPAATSAGAAPSSSAATIDVGPPLSPASSTRKSTKRARPDNATNKRSSRPAKKPRRAQGDAANEERHPVSLEAGEYPRRIFPNHVPVDEYFSLLYRRFPVCSYTRKGKRGAGLNGAVWNKPRNAFDLYTPRFVKGRGHSKVGVCPVCCEPVHRGGEDRKVWLSMKFSAFKCYHMMNVHGISSTTALPFSPPVDFRTVSRDNIGKNEKSEIRQGKCHKCRKWIPVEGVKDVPTKVKEIFWWKHAASCHKGSHLQGETDIFVDDEYLSAAEADELDVGGDDDEDEDEDYPDFQQGTSQG